MLFNINFVVADKARFIMERKVSFDHTAGMSLIELLITIAIISIAMGIGTPALSDMMKDNRLVAVYNQVSSLTAFARSEASKRNVTTITLCKTSDSINCSDATAGFKLMVFVDNDGDGTVDLTTDETTDVILKTISIDNQKIKLNLIDFSSNKILFLAAGMPASPGKLMICDERGRSSISGMVMNISGQLRKAQTAEFSCS